MIVDNTPRVQLEFNQRIGLFLRQMEDTVHKASRPITPKDKGNLRDDVLKKVNGKKGTIEWRKVYAAVQERGMIGGSKIRNYTTPGTGANYAEKGVKTGIRKTSEVAKKVRLM